MFKTRDLIFQTGQTLYHSAPRKASSFNGALFFCHEVLLSKDYLKLHLILVKFEFHLYRNINSIKLEPHHEKTNNVVSEQVRHKPNCTSTEDG